MREGSGDFPGFGTVVRYAPQVFFEASLRRKHIGIQVHKVTSMPTLPGARLGNDVCCACQDRSRNTIQDLIKRDVDAIEEGSDFGIGALVKWLALPETRTIQVGGNGTFT